MNLKNNYKNFRAISPVIAIILLIGLTVIAGAVLFGVVIPLLSSQTPISLTTSNDAVFTTTQKTNVDPYMDSMSFQVSNDINDPVHIDLSHSYLYNASNGLILYNWIPNANNTQPVLSGQQGMTLSYQTDPNIPGYQLYYNQSVYVEFNVTRYDQQKSELIKSNIYTVTTANTQPIFDVTSVNSFTESGTTVFFEALPNQTVSANLSVSVWNMGSPSKAYTKSISLTLENDVFFKLNSNYQTQMITIPASTNIGTGGVCTAGLPCINVNFPISRVNLTGLGYPNGINVTYGAQLYLSGTGYYPYTLNITTPQIISMILPNSLVTKGTGNGRIANSNLIYNGPYNAENSLDLTITIWNGDKNPINTNIYLQGLNTTAFRLDSPNMTSIYVPTGTMPSSLNSCDPTTQPCTSVTWTITRLPLYSTGNQPTGVAAGAYNINIALIGSGVSLPVILYANGPGQQNSPYIYVNSISWSQNTKQNILSSSVEIYDANFNVIKGAIVTVNWKTPDGTTSSLSSTTNNKGIATFSKALTTGVHTLTVTNVSNTGNVYETSLNKITQSSFTANDNYVYIENFGWSYKSAAGQNPASLTGTFTIYDQGGNKISGVVVSVIWQYNSVNQSQIVYSQPTNPQGQTVVTYTSPVTGSYKIYVNNVTLANYYYKPSSDLVTFPQSYNAPLLQLESINNLSTIIGSNNGITNSLSTNNIFNSEKQSNIQIDLEFNLVNTFFIFNYIF